MTIKVGDKIPQSTFKYQTSEGPKEISSAELFGGKKVALFAVPGAFTPTCSQRHLPGYVDKAAQLKANKAIRHAPPCPVPKRRRWP